LIEPCESIAVILFQLGGPDSLEAVEPFLFNLFSDPDIIDFPFARLARPTMARLISSRRARHVQEHYAAIGGRSPIGELTERQRTALEQELREARGLEARVFVAMRYWHPLTEAAVEQIQRGNFRAVVLLPLYPQYSKTTTGSSLNEWRRLQHANGHRPVPARTIRYFYDHSAYLDALVEKINEGLARFLPAGVILSPDAVHRDEESRQFEVKKVLRGAYADGELTKTLREVHPERSERAQGESACPQDGKRKAKGDRKQTQDDRGKAWDETRSADLAVATSLQCAPSADDVWLVFSAHGVPMKVIESGDPYQRQIEETVRLVMERGGWRNPHVLCWQSRVNPGKWLEPSLGATLRPLAARGAERVLVIPISFVTDHVETLAEIDIEARALASQVGIRQFELMPALNDSPTFIRALADLVVAQVDSRQTAETQRAQR
jgi:protoheme ferro-lyase